MLTTFPLSLLNDTDYLYAQIDEYLALLKHYKNVFYDTPVTVARMDEERHTLQPYQDLFDYLNIINYFTFKQEWQDILQSMYARRSALMGQEQISIQYHQHFLTILNDPALTDEERADIRKNYDQFYQTTGRLTPEQHQILVSLNQELTTLIGKYSATLIGFNQNATLTLRADEVSDIDPDILHYVPRTEDGYIFNIDQWLTHVLTHSKQDNVRQKIYALLQQKGTSEPWNVEPIVERIGTIRHQIANIYGFEHYADYATNNLMATNAATVAQLVQPLYQSTQTTVAAYNEELKMLAFERGIPHTRYNQAYLTRLHDESTFHIDQEEIQSYFLFDHNINMLHQWIEEQYGLHFEIMHQEMWHPDVRPYRVTKNNEIYAYLYIDPFERDGKNNGAFFLPHQFKSNLRHEKTIPTGTICTNFRNDELHTMHISEIKTLWHEYGHALHHFLIESDLAAHSGMNVEQDAVELPSTLMAYLIDDYAMITRLSTHKTTGEPIPESMYNQYLAYQKTKDVHFLRNLSQLACFDNILHHSKTSTKEAWNATVNLSNINPQWSMTYTSPLTLEHLYTYQMAGTFYNYIWADIMCHDILDAMKKDSSVWARYNQCILTQGSKKPMKELYELVLGRPMSIHGMLRYYALDVPSFSEAELLAL